MGKKQTDVVNSHDEGLRKYLRNIILPN